MKTKRTKILCTVLSIVLILQALVMLAACKTKLDSETTPLILSTDALDGVFNPFSYTSGADGGVVGQTQLAMTTLDDKGEVVVGWDQPTVAEAYSVVTTGTQENYDRDGDYSNFYTDYYFAIKDGIKFSDGSDLTIKDILFNMYVYLDPVYTGSSTMYSTEIQGLSAYRTQDDSDNAQSNLNELANAYATQRWQRLVSWCSDDSNPALESYFAGADLEEVKNDIEKIKSLFKEELNTDWVAALSAVEEYEKYYLLTDETRAITTDSAWKEYTKEGNSHKHISEQWEVFMLMYGGITTQVEKLQEVKKYTFEYNGSDSFAHDQTSMVNRVYTDFFPSDETSQTFKNKLLEVITLYNTSNTYFEYAVNSEKQKLLKDGDFKYDHISGITVYMANSIPASKVSSGERTFDSDRYILKIRINGLDPKALYSFSFSVAPMNYYSTKEAIDEFVELPDTTDEEGHVVKNYRGFGVKYADPNFMDAINTNLVPRGAGPYRASNGKEAGVGDTATVQRSEFFSNNIVNFERNNYFHTVMKDGHDSYIKFLRYKVIAANAMVDAVTGKNPEVYVSQPSATSKVREEVSKLSGVEAIFVDYMGYGYIGVNANYVKDVNVRRAIMYAMDISLCYSYYGSSDLVELIYRSMSKNNWAYPKGLNEQYYPFDESGETSKQLVADAGYSVDSKTGILTNDKGEQLKFTFTVAGDTEDHPAYQTMAKAKTILDKIGFDITVTKDTQALSKLASGGLQVWAAAWSSSVDPDMYQVYHKDSTASSIKNWGYPYLLRDGTSYEKDLLDQLAEQIELGRKYNTREERMPYYSKALDLVMDLAVELPTYQRKEMYLINTDIVDKKTLCKANIYQSPISKIWDVNFVGAK